MLLAQNGIARVDDCPVIDALGATVKMAESLADLRRSSGLVSSRRGYFRRRPPAGRVDELMRFYGLERFVPRD